MRKQLPDSRDSVMTVSRRRRNHALAVQQAGKPNQSSASWMAHNSAARQLNDSLSARRPGERRDPYLVQVRLKDTVERAAKRRDVPMAASYPVTKFRLYSTGIRGIIAAMAA
jgi:hypothetical protein